MLFSLPETRKPNHALQRTEAGGGVFSVYRALLRQPLSLSLDSLGASRRHTMSATKSLPAKQTLWARLTKLSPKQLDRWARTRAKGRGRYILLWGVCGFGGWMLLCTDLAPALWRHLHHEPAFNQRTFHYVFDSVYYLIAGYIVAAVNWSACERRFHGFSNSASSNIPAPNHALQRTEAGGRVSSKFQP